MIGSDSTVFQQIRAAICYDVFQDIEVDVKGNVDTAAEWHVYDEVDSAVEAAIEAGVRTSAMEATR